MLKKAQVVMLTTEKESRLSQNSTGKLHYENDSYGHSPNFTPKHLYFVIDTEIKEGDWYITPALNTYFQAVAFPLAYKDAKKVIATTNPDLWIKQLPNMGEGMGWRPSDIARIPTDFVEAYVREQGNISEVILEYEDLSKNIPHNEKFAIHEEWLTRLRLRANGTVIIHPVKPKVYTRDELEDILFVALQKVNCSPWDKTSENHKKYVKDWFNKHYPVN